MGDDMAESGRGRVRGRGRAALLLVAALAACLPVAAGAHGGTRTVHTTAGPYRVEAYVSRFGSEVDESVLVSDAVSGQALAALVVTLTLRRGSDTRGPFPARLAGGQFEARYPTPDGNGWNVTIAIDGPKGSATVEHAYVDPASGRGGELLNLGMVVILMAGTFLAYRLWLRPRAGAVKEEGSAESGPAPDRA
jgi:hypothetical protein